MPRLRTLLGLVTAAQYGLAIFEGTFVLYARDRLSLTAGQTSVAFVVCGVVMALQVPASALMTKVAGPLSQVAIGFALMGIGISALLTTTSYPVVLAMVAVLAAGAALVIPNLSALVTIGQRTSTSVALGWKSSASSLGQFLGPVVGGSLIAKHADLPFLIAGVLLTGVGVGIAIACRRSKSQLGQAVRPHAGKPTVLSLGDRAGGHRSQRLSCRCRTAALGATLLNVVFHLANASPHPWLIPRNGFDEGVDLDSLLPMVQLVLIAVSVRLFTIARGDRHRGAVESAGIDPQVP